MQTETLMDDGDTEQRLERHDRQLLIARIKSAREARGEQHLRHVDHLPTFHFLSSSSHMNKQHRCVKWLHTDTERYRSYRTRRRDHEKKSVDRMVDEPTAEAQRWRTGRGGNRNLPTSLCLRFSLVSIRTAKS